MDLLDRNIVLRQTRKGNAYTSVGFGGPAIANENQRLGSTNSS